MGLKQDAKVTGFDLDLPTLVGPSEKRGGGICSQAQGHEEHISLAPGAACFDPVH